MNENEIIDKWGFTIFFLQLVHIRNKQIQTNISGTNLRLHKSGKAHLDALLAHALIKDGKLVLIIQHLEVHPCDEVPLLVPGQQAPESVH